MPIVSGRDTTRRDTGANDRPSKRIVVCAPEPAVRRWVEEELAGFTCRLEAVGTVTDAKRALGEAPHAAIFIVDVDSLDAEGARELQKLGDERWNGKVIVLGRLPRELRRTLRVAHRIARPFGSEALRVLVSDTASTRETMQLRAL